MFLISSRYFVIVLWISCCVIDNILFFFIIAIFFLFLWGIQWLFGKFLLSEKPLFPPSGTALFIALTSISHVGNFPYTWQSWANGSWWSMFASFMWVNSLWILLWEHLDGSFCGNSSRWRHKVSLGVFFLVGLIPQKTSRFSPKRWGLPARLCLSLLHMVPTSQFCQM